MRGWRQSVWRRERTSQRGIALLAVLVGMLLVTLVVAGLVMATVRETTVAFAHMRGQQALALAEAGAYRALAELRHRVVVDLDAQLRRLAGC